MNVIVLKEKLDALAEAIGIKSKVRLPLTIDEQIEAVNLIKTDPKLQDKSVSLTPKATAQTATVTADSGYDGLNKVAVNVAETPLQDYNIGNLTASGNYNYTPQPPYIGYSNVKFGVPTTSYGWGSIASYLSISGVRYWAITPNFNVTQAGWLTKGIKIGTESRYNAVPKNTTITPSTEAQTIGGANYMLEGAITVNPIPNNYGLITYNGTTITVS